MISNGKSMKKNKKESVALAGEMYKEDTKQLNELVHKESMEHVKTSDKLAPKVQSMFGQLIIWLLVSQIYFSVPIFSVFHS